MRGYSAEAHLADPDKHMGCVKQFEMHHRVALFRNERSRKST